MKLSAVILARALAFVETYDLNPRGSVFYPNLIAQLVERYRFQKFPKSFDELDEAKGIEFHEGLAGKIIILKFTIFSNILVAETRSNTSDSRAVIEDMANWGVTSFGLKPLSEVLRHWAYVSDLTFTSDFDVLGTSPLAKLAQKTAGVVSDLWRDSVKYQSLMTGVGHDPLVRKNGIANFTITRRVETPFWENKFFSEAPLPTDLHIQFLEEYESDMKRLKDGS